MKISQEGIELIKRWEGLKLQAYLDGGGVATIGYGHTKNVKQGDIITPMQAEAFLKKDLGWAEETIHDVVKVPLTQYQYDALVSLCFNIGAYAFTKSTLVKFLNKMEYDNAATQFVRWSYDNGKMIQGLKNRRLDETQLFLGD